MHKCVKDITNNRYGRLVVIGYEKSIKKLAYWKCICDCGKECVVRGSSLRQGQTKSCGCYAIDRTVERSRKEFGENSKRYLYNRYKGDARRRNIPFDLTIDQFVFTTSQSCYYCGALPNQEAFQKYHYGKYIYNGIDRVDNNLGYTESNIVSCCKMCNTAKLTYTQEEFINMCKKVAALH